MTCNDRTFLISFRSTLPPNGSDLSVDRFQLKSVDRSKSFKDHFLAVYRLLKLLCLFSFVMLKAEWKPVGCFKNVDRALDEVVARVANKPSISSRYDACVAAADQAGITLFGLDDRRCWTSQRAYSSYDKYGTSGHCKTKKGKTAGLTEHGTMFVYQKDYQGNSDLTSRRPM